MRVSLKHYCFYFSEKETEVNQILEQIQHCTKAPKAVLIVFDRYFFKFQYNVNGKQKLPFHSYTQCLYRTACVVHGSFPPNNMHLCPKDIYLHFRFKYLKH